MNILYISRLTSERLINDIYRETGKNPGFAIQKFSGLLTKGLVKNGANVCSLSTPPYSRKNTQRRFIRVKEEVENDIKFYYIPVFNIPVIKNIIDFCYVFFFILKWIKKSKDKHAVLFDALNVSACMSGILACKFAGIDSVGVVTDMPGMMNSRQSKSIIGRIATSINNKYLGAFDKYVFITEQMNVVINKKTRPYIIMEGLVDADLIEENNVEKEKKRLVLYAGGLHERYGLKTLVEGFLSANIDDAVLHLYGTGPFVNELKEYEQRDSRICYMGVRPNKEIVEAEFRATLLINPRPTNEEFTKYSFPSKNMEYMVSGTPLLTTALPGMPSEYYDYVYIFDQGETVEGYSMTLRHVLTLPLCELETKGRLARQWVLANKNHIKQANRILKMVEC